MHNTQNHERFGPIKFPMSEITDWDNYAGQYEAEQNAFGLRKAEIKRARGAEEDYEYDEDHPAFGTREWIDKEKGEAKRDLRRFLGKRGLLENSAL
jgi:hypothetical protein